VQHEAALLDELAANATAAPTVQLVDGWVLRAAPALPFRRSSCVLPWGGPDQLAEEPLEARLAIVRDFYAQRGLPARVQLGAAPRPLDLDARLAERGWAVETPVDVLAAAVHDVAASTVRPCPDALHVEVSRGVDEGWVTRYADAHAHDDVTRERVRAYGTLLAQIGPTVLTVAANLDGGPAGVGFGVVERGWLGVFGMATHASVRRRGVATAVLHSLARAAEGATRTYLQVERDNLPARDLYARAGFAVSYGYHYRTLERPGSGARAGSA
jgi:GNAT superfamily N-acetyltransferase